VEEAIAEAQRRVRDADEEAHHRIADAERRVLRLRELRGRIAKQLREVTELLRDVPGVIAEMDDERPLLAGGEPAGRLPKEAAVPPPAPAAHRPQPMPHPKSWAPRDQQREGAPEHVSTPR
jgi:hypothetical protein